MKYEFLFVYLCTSHAAESWLLTSYTHHALTHNVRMCSTYHKLLNHKLFLFLNTQQFPQRLFFPTTTRSITLRIWKTFVAIPTMKSSTMIPTTTPLRSIHAVVHHLQPTCGHCCSSHRCGIWMPILRQPKIFGGRSTW